MLLTPADYKKRDFSYQSLSPPLVETKRPIRTVSQPPPRGAVDVLSRLWDGMHIIAMTFNPLEDSENISSFKCFFYSIFDLIPSDTDRKLFWAFVKEYPIDNYLTSKSRVFQWTWLLHQYIDKGKPSSKPTMTLMEANRLYSEDSITKKRWGNALWTIIHTISKYLPSDKKGVVILVPVRSKFILFIVCVQKLLPCKKCSKHMGGHMEKYPITIEDTFEKPFGAFVWGYRLHLMVAEQIHKESMDTPVKFKSMDLKTAWSLY